MAIRRLEDHEFEQAYALDCYAFQVADPEESRARAKRSWNDATTYGEVSDGKVLAKVELLDFDVNVFGHTMRMGGLAGVASYPEQRRKGLITQLMSYTLKTMREEGHVLSYLHPFAIGFYRKFGWEIAFDEATYTLQLSEFPKPDRKLEGEFERIPFADPRIRTLYDKSCSHGMLVRENWWWEALVEKYAKHETVLYTDSSGVPTAYMVYKVKNHRFETEELVYSESSGLKALLSFIGQHDSMVESVEITAAGSEHVAYFLPDPKAKAAIHPYFMARIVEVEAFLKEYPFTKGTSMSFTLQIEDAYAEWNNQTFAVSIEDGQGSCGLSSEQPTISMTIQTLTSLMLGYRRPSFYLKQGLIKGDNEAIQRFVSLIPGDEPALIDFF
ncbi:enhanced intracellular survival protein Eis [Alkalihalobacillus sp. NPDC078783]